MVGKNGSRKPSLEATPTIQVGEDAFFFSIIYCCLTNHPKTCGLKHQTFVTSHRPVGRWGSSASRVWAGSYFPSAFVCLTVFKNCLPGVHFTLFGIGCFYISMNIPKLCSGIQLNLWSFQVLF